MLDDHITPEQKHQSAQATRAQTAYTQRARYAIPANVFKSKRAAVPAHMFIEERDQVFAKNSPSGLIALDLSDQLGFDFAATTPFLLARYVKLCGADRVATGFQCSGEIYYVIRGSGVSKNGADSIAWQTGDVFCFPGGQASEHETVSEDSILLMFTDEPLYAYTHASAPTSDNSAIHTVHYPAEAIDKELDAVYARADNDDAAGMAVQFISQANESLGTCLPSIALAVNTLAPGSAQRAHIHNAVALTLCIQGQGCYSVIDGQRVDWQANTLMVTPPTAVHSHHNEGNELMRCLIAQDGGLYYHARTVGFQFAD